MADNVLPKSYPILYVILMIIILPALVFSGKPTHKSIKRKSEREIIKKDKALNSEIPKKKTDKRIKKKASKPIPKDVKKSTKSKKVNLKEKTSNKAYFENVMSVYQSNVYEKLERPADRTDMVIRYYKKDQDQGIVYSLKSLGFYIHERPSDDNYFNSTSNAIYYGDSISRSDIEVIAYRLISAGMDLKIIAPSKYHDTWKAHSLEIGSDTLFTDEKSITLSDIRKNWGNN